MRITMPYGDTVCDAEIAWGKCLGTLDIRDMPELPDIEGAVREALEHPIGLDRPLAALVSPGETVAILVSDAFRHTGVDRTLPVILAVLNKAGIPDSAITIVFATGTHRPPTLDEQARILGPELDARMTKRIVHDPENMFNFDYVGKTSRGTRVELNKAVMAHDRIVATGAVVLHYFAGYGGGRKSVVPGIASAETIAHNHAMNLDPHEDRLNPNVRIGALEGNPVAEDMLEAARFAQVDCIVNTVLNRQGQIAGVFAGELDAAHRAAAQFARGLFAVDIKERADLVIASAGSAKNFVQCHKALFNAYQAVFPAGRIVFVAQCPEGLGGDQFEKWVRLGTRRRIIAGLREKSEINGQTALSTIDKAPITIMVTDLPRSEVAALGARKAATLQDALNRAHTELREMGTSTRNYYLMPSAAYTVPFLKA